MIEQWKENSWVYVIAECLVDKKKNSPKADLNPLSIDWDNTDLFVLFQVIPVA